MLENLKTRILIILFFLVASIYFLIPTINLYSQQDKLSASEQKALEDESINLGLDLKGGLRIVLELDDSIFLKRLSKPELRKSSKLELEKFILQCMEYSKKNNLDIIKSIAQNSSDIKLNKF